MHEDSRDEEGKVWDEENRGAFGMLSGIILAGGEDRSLRTELTSLHPVDGETLIGRQLRLMGELCEELIVVTEHPRAYLTIVDPPVRIVSAYGGGTGPLAGLAAGLSLARQPYAWVVGADLPDPSPEAAKRLMRKLAVGIDAAWPADGDGVYPLHALYACECSSVFIRLAEEGRASLDDLPARLIWKSLTAEECERAGIGFEFVRRLGGGRTCVAADFSNIG